MNGRYLLDTNVVIAIFAEEQAVLQHPAEAQEVFVPAVVLGELYYGAGKSARVEANMIRIDEFAATAKQCGWIKNDLRVKGRPIPENDIWIAAVARQHGLDVVSRDDHFRDIGQLQVEVW